jgi:hypothetical protein
MNHLKLYESIKDDNFFENSKLYYFFEKEKEYKINRDNILNLINKYIEINEEYFLDKYNIKPNQKNFSIEIINEPPYDRLAIKLLSIGWLIYLNDIDFKKLIEFIENPDLYINSHKYNL